MNLIEGATRITKFGNSGSVGAPFFGNSWTSTFLYSEGLSHCEEDPRRNMLKSVRHTMMLALAPVVLALPMPDNINRNQVH